MPTPTRIAPVPTDASAAMQHSTLQTVGRSHTVSTSGECFTSSCFFKTLCIAGLLVTIAAAFMLMGMHLENAGVATPVLQTIRDGVNFAAEWVGTTGSLFSTFVASVGVISLGAGIAGWAGTSCCQNRAKTLPEHKVAPRSTALDTDDSARGENKQLMRTEQREQAVPPGAGDTDGADGAGDTDDAEGGGSGSETNPPPTDP